MTNEELISAIIEDKFNNVKKIAEEKFGEERIDYQLPSIAETRGFDSIQEYYGFLQGQYGRGGRYSILDMIIYFPHKTVICNETGQTHDVKDIYCKVGLLNNSSFSISTGRATYSIAEMNSGYTHSHVSGISTPGRVWLITCLGNDSSPLNRLRDASTRDDLDWINVFNEIDRFYEVESLRGVPYIRMENISEQGYYTSPKDPLYQSSHDKLYKLDAQFSDFAYYVLGRIKEDNHLISNIDGEFTINVSLYDFKLLLTNYIVDYLKMQESILGVNYKDVEKQFKKVLEENVITKYGEYTSVGHRGRGFSYRDTYLFTFKGRRILRKVNMTDRERFYLMPNKEFQTYVFLKILIMLNYERFRESRAETVKVVL